MTPIQQPKTQDFLAVEEELNRRVRRFLAVTLLMLLASGAALRHLATALQARAGDARGYARRP